MLKENLNGKEDTCKSQVKHPIASQLMDGRNWEHFCLYKCHFIISEFYPEREK